MKLTKQDRILVSLAALGGHVMHLRRIHDVARANNDARLMERCNHETGVALELVQRIEAEIEKESQAAA